MSDSIANWKLLCDLASAPDTVGAKRFIIDDIPIALALDSHGKYHAIGDICSHGDFPLSDGDVNGIFIECLGHGSNFDLYTGRPRELPAYSPVDVYEIKIENSNIYIQI